MRDWRSDIRSRLAGTRLDPSSEAEIVEEIGQHLDDRVAELRSHGLSEEQAAEEIQRELEAPGFPNTLLARRRTRYVAPAPVGAAAGVSSRIALAWSDVRFGLRSLAHAPVFAIVAVLSLALGIGATTAIFGLLNAVLLERLPTSHPEQLIGIQRSPGVRKAGDRISFREYEPLSRTPGLPKLAASFTSSLTVVEDNVRDFVSVDQVTGGFFDLLGVHPILGRLIDAHDDATPVVVIGEDYWRNHFAADPGVLSRAIAFNGQPFAIIGVVPRDYRGVLFGGAFSMAIPLGAAKLAGGADIR